MSIFADGLKSLVSTLTNSRNPLNTNTHTHSRISYDTLNALYKSGILNKIINIKSGYALRNTLDFDTQDDADIYSDKLAACIREAARYMLAFGRGIIVINEGKGANLAEPLGRNVDISRASLHVFSGDMVTVSKYGTDLMGERYYKPLQYNVRGYAIHWTRVIDFTYTLPVELDRPTYQFGGISETEYIYDQLTNDGLIQRASAFMMDKGARTVYKISGFKDALQAGRENDVITYFQTLENYANISTATLLDAEDTLETLSIRLQHLKEVDELSLRRLAFVTGIPLAYLVGENVKGLNSTGDNERLIFWEMIADFQDAYLVGPINELMSKLGLGKAYFKEARGVTAPEQLEYDKLAIENATALTAAGLDGAAYLDDKGVIRTDTYKAVVSTEPDPQQPDPQQPDPQQPDPLGDANA